MSIKTAVWFLFIVLVVSEILIVEGKHHRPEKESRKKKVLNKHRKPVTIKTADNAEPRVQLKNTTVIGTRNQTTSGNTTYFSFRGIPYAKPPIGELRFRPPVPLPHNFSERILNATKDGSICTQSDIAPHKVIGSEDCLYINIYLPQLPRQNGSLYPVMVWIYGGGFFIGDSRYTSFGPDYFMDEGTVIIVSFNYRVGIFGFLSTEDEVSPGNYGFKDQILALQWVQQNIQYFGGNPEEVTIFGESAGAASVSYLTQTNLTNGLYRGAIMESGNSLCLWALTRNAKHQAVSAGNFLRLDTSTSKSLVHGLRKANYKDVQAAAALTEYEGMLFGNPLDGLPFGPTIEVPNPGAVIINKSYEQLAHGQFRNISYLIGFNSNEAAMFSQIVNWVRLYIFKYDISLDALVPSSMNIDDFPTRVLVNGEIKFYYFGFEPLAFATQPLFQFISDDEFVRPIVKAAQLISRKSPVHLYKFSYAGSLGSANSTDGVGHAQELPYLWKMQDIHNYITQDDKLMIRKMIRLWTNFAIAGTPTPLQDPLLQNLTWPLLNQAGDDNVLYLNISLNSTVGKNPQQNNLQFWNDLFEKHGRPPYSTY